MRKQNKQVKENNTERKRAMAKELSRRFREKNRLNVLNSVHHVVNDSQIPGPSHENPTLAFRNQRTTIHDSQIAGTYRIGENLFVTTKRRKSTSARP